MTYTTTTAGAALGLSPRTIRWYYTQHGIGSRHGRDLLLTDEDLAEIAVHQARGPGKPAGGASPSAPGPLI